MSEPPGESRIDVALEAGACRYDLRLCGSDDTAVPAWWVGVFTGSGDCLRTAVSLSTDLSPIELELWLRPIVGRDVAEELVRLVAEAVSVAHGQRRAVGSGH
jgi:hypothetical protein